MKKGSTMIYEPMTAFTDLLITIFALYFAWRLSFVYRATLQNTTWHWIRVFWFLALGSFLGAVSHGLGPYFSPALRDGIWKATTLSIGLVSCFFLLAGGYTVFNYATMQWIRWLPVLALAAYTVVILRDARFINVVKFYAPSLVLVLLFMIYLYFQGRVAGSGAVALGIGISFLAAGIQVSGWDLHPSFNHNDVYHVVQILGMYSIYQGARLLMDVTV
ncbi:MAG: hypothetical protein D6762_02620 [Candidatus Neomarinimicrobiota bacterium]|nr:MAG: hypothetical protein D6762_02620 [Candidatus Neomarinimicrobiota bacterium]